MRLCGVERWGSGGDEPRDHGGKIGTRLFQARTFPAARLVLTGGPNNPGTPAACITPWYVGTVFVPPRDQAEVA
jgi:hypothetical protein